MFIQVTASIWTMALGLYGLREFMRDDSGAGMLLAAFQALVLIAIWAPVQ